LVGARLSGASLVKARLKDADLTRAILDRANLMSTNANGAIFSGAVLRDADLRDSNLYQADLSNANLRGANLERADLTAADLTGARFDVHTRWPIGFDRWGHGAIAWEFLGPEDSPDTYYVTAQHTVSEEFYLLRFQDRVITGCIPHWSEDESLDVLTYRYEDHPEDTEWAIAHRDELNMVYGIAEEDILHPPGLGGASL
jgi:hypothetical protein